MNEGIYEWHECRPNNMPEDILLGYCRKRTDGRKFYPRIIISDKPSAVFHRYMLRMRLECKNKTRFTWCGRHPRYWRMLTDEEYTQIKQMKL